MKDNLVSIGPYLNLPGEGSRYITRYGDITSTIPEMISSHYMPLSISQIMQRQLDVIGARDEVFDFWWNHAFITSTVIVYHPGGKIKIVTNGDLAGRIHARDVNEEVKVLPYTRFGYGFALPANEYEKLPGKEFSRNECFGKAMQHDVSFVFNSTSHSFYVLDSPTIKYGNINKESIETIINNPIWQALAEDNNLLKEYITLGYKYFELNINTRAFKVDIHIASVQPMDASEYLTMYPLEFWTNEMIAIGRNYDVCRINYGKVESRKRVIEEKRIVGKLALGYSPSDSDPRYKKTISDRIKEKRKRQDRFGK